MRDRLKEWLGRDDSPLMRYAAWQVECSKLPDTGLVCPTCLHIRMFCVPLLIGVVCGTLFGLLF